MNFIFILKLILMSDINQLKHFDALDYKGEYFTNELKDGEEFLYSTIKIQDDSKVTFLCKIDKGYTPRPKQIIDCVEVEISPDNWIMSVDANNTDLAILSVYYHIDWKECRCLKGVKLEDVTPELEQKAFEEMK